MALPQVKFREIVFQLLYSHAYGDVSDEEMVSFLMQELAVTKKAVREAAQKVASILEHLPEIDKVIASTSHSFTFQRIQSVELNILRLGTFELMHDETIPPKVAISEAIRLARKFGSPESALFVNAILDNIYKSMLGEKIDPTTIENSLVLLEENETLSQKGHEMRERERLQNDESIALP